MADDTLRMPVIRTDLDHAIWWEQLWKMQEFETWADVTGWLWDVYRAEIFKIPNWFEIRFRYEEEATLFRLTWT
jgi:hypothetical protein